MDVSGRLTKQKDPILQDCVKMHLNPNLGLARNVLLSLANRDSSQL
jgi:hypothetical protein